MTWVQQNYDRFLLAVFAVLLLACAGLLFNNAHNFATVFETLKSSPPQGKTVPGVQQETVEKQEAQLAEPDQWKARMLSKNTHTRLPVFVSVPYIAKTTTAPDGSVTQELIDPLDGASDRQLHPPVPNAWLIDNQQDLLSPNVLEQDSDGDGFSTLDEWKGKTNPLDKNSHPPYYTKMVYAKFVPVPFRLRFDAKNGDTIQINAVDVQDAPTLFVKVGQMIKDTKFKVVKFEAKTRKETNGMVRDVSEVTVENQENKEQIVLPKQQEVNSPTTYAVISYLWTGKQFAVKKNQEFTIDPEKNVKYKCVDLNDKEVNILKEDENKTLMLPLTANAPAK